MAAEERGSSGWGRLPGRSRGLAALAAGWVREEGSEDGCWLEGRGREAL